MAKGIFLVSVNSQKLIGFLNSQSQSNLNVNTQDLDLFVFDVVEILNGVFFQNENANVQKNKIDNIISLVKEKLITNTTTQKLILYKETLKVLKPYLAAVYNEYYTNKKFEHHCKSQIFQNLQPKLRQISITNHKTELIELLAPYILSEIAFYMYLYDKSEYDIIYGFENEMNIITAIKENKYPSLNNFLTKKINYFKIEANAPTE